MKTKKLYRNKEWLKDKYIDERLSMYQIAKLYGLSLKFVSYWLYKFNIPIRSFSEAALVKSKPKHIKFQNKEWLEKKYLKEKLSATQISKLCRVSHATIQNWLHKLNIPARSCGEAIHLVLGNHCDLSHEAIEWINGELLGDGCLTLPSNYSSYFSYGSKHLEYAQYVSDTLKSFGIKQVGRIIKKQDKYKNYAYFYVSHSYEELLSIRKQWYPNNKKIVPKDIELTPLTCRQWYIGDGCLIHKKNRNLNIVLATNGFPSEDVEWLVDQLNKIGFKATRQPSQNVINISTISVKQFLNYIGECPVKCYQYKWRL